MSTLIWKAIRRSRPPIGWPQAVLALSAALCPALAASDSRLVLPAWLFFWAGAIGLWAGMRAGHPAIGQPSRAADRPRDNPPRRTARAWPGLVGNAARFTGWLAFILGFAALLAIAAGQALPPLGLITQDIAAWLGWLLGMLRRSAGLADMPPGRVWEFLAASLPRFWQNLIVAPYDGERGARLLVAAGGAVATWIGALLLGWGLVRRHSVFAWGAPLLLALMAIAVLGGGSGTMLLPGLVLLLMLAIVAGFNQRELIWESTGTDYSDELGTDVLTWGTLIATGLIGLALLLPTSLSNPLADLLWRDVELPSGIAELEKNIPRPPPPPRKADIGLSTLPGLDLGQSLEQSPPETIALRVRLNAPFPPAPWPRYWRARVFNIYNGRGWTTNARIGSFDSTMPPDGTIPGGVLQEIEDLRKDRTILPGLPDVFSASVPAQAERLPDGALAALTDASQPQRYRMLSRPQELAPLPRPDAPPEDLSAYVALPRNYPPRVGDLARVIAGDKNNQLDQALALENYLRELPYSYQVRPLPSGGDAVEQFLFDMRQGYCTYYASSMAMMARTLGIPARVAIGYATGEYDPAAGAYIVREADAHAWPELYVGGQWLPFEPTPIRPIPARSTGAEPAPLPEVAATEPEGGVSGPLIWAAVLAIVALLTALGLWMGRTRPVCALALEVQRRLERLGARAGVPWPDGATLNEYGELLEPKTGSDAGALHEVVDLVGRARYSGRPLGGEEESRLRVAAERVWARLARRR